MTERPGDMLLVGDDNGLSATDSTVTWWHRCTEGWAGVELPPDSLRGSLDNDVTVSAPLLCPNGCGMHGAIDHGTWVSAN